MSFFVGQMINLNNEVFNVSTTGKIIKITSKYLICKKIKTFNTFSLCNDDKFIKHINYNINDDTSDKINLYGSYNKKYNNLDEYDILYNDDNVNIKKTNTSIIY